MKTFNSWSCAFKSLQKVTRISPLKVIERFRFILKFHPGVIRYRFNPVGFTERILLVMKLDELVDSDDATLKLKFDVRRSRAL